MRISKCEFLDKSGFLLTSVRNQNAFDRYGCFDIFTGGQGCSGNERNSGFGFQDQPQPQRGEQHLELCIYHVFVTPIALRDGCGLLCVLQLCAKCWLSYDLEQEGEAEQGEIFYRAEMFHWVLLSKQSKQVVISDQYQRNCAHTRAKSRTKQVHFGCQVKQVFCEYITKLVFRSSSLDVITKNF